MTLYSEGSTRSKRSRNSRHLQSCILMSIIETKCWLENIVGNYWNI